MREIKFRAWDKKAKVMLSWKEIEHWGITEDILICGKKFIPMQYTGLKDKNGKEIWEGDMLSYYFHLKKGWEVFFEDGCYYMTCGIHSFLFEKMRAIESEIIGNIYENPELIRENEITL